jgi:hypothetical protein
MHEYSDLDVAVVSSDFGVDRFEEGKMQLQTAWRIDPRLHPVPVSLDAFRNDTWVPLIHEIREHGRQCRFDHDSCLQTFRPYGGSNVDSLWQNHGRVGIGGYCAILSEDGRKRAAGGLGFGRDSNACFGSRNGLIYP